MPTAHLLAALGGLLLPPATALAFQETEPDRATETAEDTLTISPTRDLITARHEFFESETHEEQVRAFEQLSRELGSTLVGRLYEWESEEVRRAVRMEALGWARQHPDFFAFLRDYVCTAPPHYDDLRRSAAQILADDADAADLAAILRSAEASGSHSATYPFLVRTAGRAVPHVESRSEDGRDPVASVARDLLWECVGSGSARLRGAGAAGLIESGLVEDGAAYLNEALGDLNDAEAMMFFYQCRRSLLRDDLDPSLRARVRERAVAVVVDYLESAAGPIGGVTGLSPRLLRFREGHSLVLLLGESEDGELLLRGLTHDGASSILGLDGLQRSRLWLQYRRDELSAETRSSVDQAFYRTLYDMGERLFDIEDLPMDEEERAHYLETRDVRFNCAGYFIGLWEDEEDVRTLWTDDGAAAEFLELLVLSEREEGEGTVGDKIYHAMRDKLEARVQMGRLLAKICRDSDTQVQEIDLGAFFVKIAAREMGNAPETTMLDQFNDWRQGTALRVALHLPEPRAPNDDWVKRAALSGLKIIGYDVTILEDHSALIERTPADE